MTVVTLELWTKIPKVTENGDAHYELVETIVALPREFWRYLLAGLLAAGQSAGTNGDEVLPSQVVNEADALLVELEKTP